MLTFIAWNGIQLSIPSTWKIGRIDARHLLFDGQSGPAMEIKWGSVKGRFSHRSHLKKLTAQQKHLPDKTLAEWHLPGTWENALSGYVSKGFSWQSDKENGRGAILFCPACKTAIMFQIFNIKDAVNDKTTLKMLKSLCDHRRDDQTAWAVFDINALLPKTFRLNRHQFKPGSYELTFSNKFQTIQLFRWAPASVFLSHTSLAQFTENILNINQQNLASESASEHPAVEWRANIITGWQNRLYWFKRKPAFHWARVWQVPEKNRILGIRIDSKKPFNSKIMRDICANYVVGSDPAVSYQGSRKLK